MTPALYLALVMGSFVYGLLLLLLQRFVHPEFALMRGMCVGAGWAYLIAAVCMAWLLEVQP